MGYSPFRHIDSIFWKKEPIQLTLFLTSRCNAKCQFCFYLSGKNNTHDKELSLSEIQNISASLGNLLWLAFSGGEIYLRNDLVDIAEIFYKRNKPSIILLPTNGLMEEKIYHDTEAVLKKCPDSIVTVKLSLDGPKKTHDALRGVNGAFDKVHSCYERLHPLLERYNNFELGINTVFCYSNQDQMEETIGLVRKLDHIKAHTISLIRGEVSDRGLKAVNLKKYKKAIDLLEGNLKNSLTSIYGFKGGRLKAAQDIVQRRLIYKTASLKKRQLPCQAGKLTVVITENGDVYPCESFKDKLGNVRLDGYNVRKILADNRSTDLIASINKRACNCTHECYMMMNVLFNPSQFPRLLKEYVQL